MKYLTRTKLTTILKWAHFCIHSNDYFWNQSDKNLYLDVIRERDNLIHEDYIKRKNKKIC